MGLKAALAKPFARSVQKKVKRAAANAVRIQNETMLKIVAHAAATAFGKDHDFSSIRNYEDFKKRVPVRDYEGLKNYVERVTQGEANVLWPGKPMYLCKTSGTTSGVKYIPISKESMPHHIQSARNALLCYVAQTGDASFVNGKMIFLQGSPELGEMNGIPYGRLSGIVAHHVPGYLQKNRMPSYKTNCIDDWETKVNAIAEETVKENMTLISGIPSWVQMYFEILLEKSGKKNIREIFPNFSLFVFGGVNYEPYRARFEKLIGKRIPSIEIYPASEGFIAYQDTQTEEGLLLVADGGTFYEFIPTEEYFNENPTRLKLDQIEVGKNYALIMNTNAGLWGYSIGDTVKFVSKNPYRLIVSGRIKHYTSAFGEHVIAEEVEYAMKRAIDKYGGQVIEFTLAPMVNPTEGLPYHEWLIEFDTLPKDVSAFAKELDDTMSEKNIYYNDLIFGHVLRPLVLTQIKRGGFNEYMKSQGKLGGQNKVPRLTNDRIIADELHKFRI
ncbi:MAG: GH3 auxin-responsive promoter family protein [Flavobacteriales bacterium]